MPHAAMPARADRVFVVLATYNGAKYLPALLESIRGQSFTNWTLLARDDGSADATPAILGDHARRDQRIVVLSEPEGNLGPVANFGALLAEAVVRGVSVVFLADQDDVWLPEKMARLLARMREAQADAGPNMPVLVHSDMTVVDSELRPIHPSFMHFQGIGHEATQPLRVLLAQNFITGCAALANRPLLELALPMPREAAMHDWWLALLAAAAGTLRYEPSATVLYRQHGENQIGAKGRWADLNPLGPRFWARWRHGERSTRNTVAQAAALRRRLGERGAAVDAGDLELIARYADCLHQGRLSRLVTLWRAGIRRQGVVKLSAQYLRFLALPRE